MRPMNRQDEIWESALFIGADGSCGFTHGKRYDIRIFIHSKKIYVGKQGGYAAFVPYDTVSALMKNWDFRRP